MKTYDSHKPLISVHIPKCGGTSFSDVLRSWFGAGFLQHYYNEKENKPPAKHTLYSGLFKKKLRTGLCIHGHFNNARGTGVLDYYPESDQLISILRNPFDVHLPTYFYVKREAKEDGVGALRAGKAHEIIEKGLSLEDYLRENKKSYICQFLPSNITLDNYKELLNEKFIFIGLTESLQGSVNILAHKLGFPTLGVTKANISEWDEGIPDGALEEFTNDNPLEMAIYNYVKNDIEKSLSDINIQNDGLAKGALATNGSQSKL
ncbi:MAG: hypothetical protein WAW75_08100 [Gallionella sp.]